MAAQTEGYTLSYVSRHTGRWIALMKGKGSVEDASCNRANQTIDIEQASCRRNLNKASVSRITEV